MFTMGSSPLSDGVALTTSVRGDLFVYPITKKIPNKIRSFLAWREGLAPLSNVQLGLLKVFF